MVQSRDHFKGFEPHTLLKHAVLKAYLQTWARKMLLRPNATSTICIVDACAGAGRDEAGNPGSPVLAAEVAAEAEEQLQRDPSLASRLPVRPRIQLVAIEKDLRNHRSLVENMKPFEERAHVMRGTLGDYISEHKTRFQDTPTLFFIDPFGLAPLEAAVIQRTLEAPRNELLLLFADQAALRHFGAATAVSPDLVAELAASTPVQGSLFESPEVQLQKARDETTERVRKKSTGQELTRRAAIAILNAAFGSERWKEIIESTPPENRRRKFQEMYSEMLRRFGATHVLPLPMRNDRDMHVYTLLHATKSAHGYTAMKEVVSTALNTAVLPAESLATMRFQISTDLGAIELQVRRRFAGRTVAWADQKDGTDNIRNFVLENTPVFNFELKALKERLHAEKCSGRGPERYIFPMA